MKEEEEDSTSMGAVRYPCMPSLVSLQQMRHRLHLAHLGKKLMTWTALATGSEMRRIAINIDMIYKTFAEDIRNAFMLLARGRYFCPVMNKMVLENVAEQASVTVGSSFKALTGVKVMQYDVIESGVEPYEHLGMEKGGQQIHEAKIAFLELIKRLVMMLELRCSFVMVETAHKSATKRKNVLERTVLPRIMITIGYILTELHEQEREERFRIKRIKEKKLQNAQTANAKTKAETETDPCSSPKVKVMETIKKPDPVCSSMKTSKTALPDPLADVQDDKALPVPLADVQDHKALAVPLADVQVKKALPVQDDKEDIKRLEHLLRHIDEVVKSLAKREGMSSKSTEEFIENCSKFKGTIKNYTAVVPPPFTPSKTVEPILIKVSSESCKSCLKQANSQYEGDPERTDEKTEEIVRVIKHRNRDGTFTDEIQTITIKTERKTTSLQNVSVKTDTVRETKSEYHKRCLNTSDDDNRKTLFALQSKADTCKKCASSRNKTGNKDTCICSSRDTKKQGSAEAIWRDTWTSITDLNVVPSKWPSKSALKWSDKSKTDQPTCVIKIVAEPPPSIILTPCKKYNTESTEDSKCLTCNYSSKSKDLGSNTSGCKNCRSKSNGEIKNKSSLCQKCQSAQEKADSRANITSCPLCEKTKKNALSHYCPMFRSPSLNSSTSQFEGKVSLSCHKAKCLICGKDKAHDFKRVCQEPKCSILSFIKCQLLNEKTGEISCPGCGASDTKKKDRKLCRSREPFSSEYGKSSENVMSEACCSLSNKSLGVATDRCKSCASSKTESDYNSDEIVEVCCSTQTARSNYSKQNDRMSNVSESAGCVGEAAEPPECKTCFQMKDAACNTKVADRYDVRPMHMLPGGMSRISCTCRPHPAPVCSCRSEPHVNRKRRPMRKVRSLKF